MSQDSKTWKETKTGMLGISLAAGLMRGLVGFPLEQPFDSIKTQWQADPRFRNEWQIFKDIYQKKGLYRGFYAGSLPNLGRILIKQFYRYPLMIGLPPWFEKKMKTDNLELVKAVSGFTIALIESLILCPFERLKVFLMTISHHQISGRLGSQWIDHFRRETVERQTNSNTSLSLLRELFRGFSPLLLRQTIAWVLWLEMDQYMKTVLRRNLGLERTEKIPNQYLLAGSFVVALTGTFVIMPFDALKTHFQKADLKVMTQRQAIMKVVKEHGPRALFVGWRLRFLGYQIHSLLTINLLDSLEVRFRKITENKD